ncbi:MAG: hypothetical protein M3O71_13460 [Bacteroidota bacterium]|nr:hypothetical protein [Bacteroidota bacterium]
MKKPLLKKNALILKVSIFLLAFLSVIVYSCRKDLAKNDKSAPVLAQHAPDITKFKNAYNKGINSRSNLKINDLSQQTISKIINNLNVDWTSYSSYTYPDSTQVIEFAMPDDSTLLVPGQLTLHDSLKYRSKTTAVFILRKDTINMSFFMKTIENETAQGSQPVLNLVRYQQIPKTFSGNVLYFTLDRQYINGYKWDNGVITKTLSLNSTTTQNTKQVNSKGTLKTNTVVADCVTTTYELYSYTYGNGVLTNTEDLGTIEVETCDYYDNGTGGSAGGGAPVPPTNPCTPPPVNVESVNGKLHVDYVAPPTDGGGGSGGTTPCPTKPPLVIKIITDSLAKHFPCAVKLIVDKLEGMKSFGDFVEPFLSSRKPDLTWQNGNLAWNAPIPNSTSTTYMLGQTGYEGRSAIITLNTSMLQNSSELLIAATAIHETIHGYINYNIETAVGGFLPPTTYTSSGSWLYSLDTWATINGLPKNYSDHYQMLSDYFSQAVTILQTWDNYAHTPTEYAEAMLFGLDNAKDGSAAQQATLQTEYNKILTTYGITPTMLTSFNKNQLNPILTTTKLPKSGC